MSLKLSLIYIVSSCYDHVSLAHFRGTGMFVSLGTTLTSRHQLVWTRLDSAQHGSPAPSKGRVLATGQKKIKINDKENIAISFRLYTG